jgi:hypothetical protein
VVANLTGALILIALRISSVPSLERFVSDIAACHGKVAPGKITRNQRVSSLVVNYHTVARVTNL